jgi:hypothetical protein
VETVLALAAAALVAAPVPMLNPGHLPRLPLRGLARQVGAAVELESLRGRVIGRLNGYQLAGPRRPHVVFLAHGRARYTVDLLERRVRPATSLPAQVPAGCRFGDESANARLFLCGGSLKTRGVRGTRTLVGAPTRVGHWEWGEFSPDGRHVLAEWSAECEIPVAYDLDVAKPRLTPLGARSVASAPEVVPLGWLGNRSPVVHVLRGGCGGGARTPGVYVFGGPKPQLLVRSGGGAPYAMWGG